MTHEEAIKEVKDMLEAKEVPYWKLKNPPNYEEMEQSMKARKSGVSPELIEYAKNAKARKYWERRAKDICSRPHITKGEVYTAIEGVKSNDDLVKLLRQHLKRAK